MWRTKVGSVCLSFRLDLVCVGGLLVCLSLLAAPAPVSAVGVGKDCVTDAQCDKGLSCQPGVHKCYHYPRHRDEPCVAGHPCKPGLTCMAGAQKCVGPAEVGDTCHATKPCAAGLSCQPGVHKCYHYPRQVGEPCVADHPCKAGLTCEAGTHVCVASSQVGDACHATKPCTAGLSCQPGVHKCYHSPRRLTEPCSAGFGCSSGLECQPFSQRCFPGKFGWDNPSSCLSVRDPAIAARAKQDGDAFSFGSGEVMNAAVVVSTEMGVVYGEQGQYGCYHTTCGGFQSDASVSFYGAVGVYGSYGDFEGTSEVYALGASPPFIELGGYTGAIVKAWPGTKVVGSVHTISVGVGLSPVQGAALRCETVVQDVLGIDGKRVFDEAAVPAKWTESVETNPTPARVPSPWQSTEVFQALDVAVGADGSVWYIGHDGPADSADRYIYQVTSQGPRKVAGSALRIAVDPSGLPWVVNFKHALYRWTGSGWARVPGEARDVGIGADGSVWTIGVDGTPRHWNGEAWIHESGKGRFVSVDPMGFPWIVNERSEIWQLTRAVYAGETEWVRLPGAARDIAISPEGVAYVVGSTLAGEGYPVFSWNHVAKSWIPNPGVVAHGIAAGPAGAVALAVERRFGAHRPVDR